MCEDNKDIKCIIITGVGEKAFAAGADIKEMKDKEYSTCINDNLLGHWE